MFGIVNLSKLGREKTAPITINDGLQAYALKKYKTYGTFAKMGREKKSATFAKFRLLLPTQF